MNSSPSLFPPILSWIFLSLNVLGTVSPAPLLYEWISVSLMQSIWQVCQRRFHLHVTSDDKDEVGKAVEIDHQLFVLDNAIMKQFHSHTFGTSNDGASEVKCCSIRCITWYNEFVGNLYLAFERLLLLLQAVYMFSRHAETHLFVVLRWSCQLCHQEIEILLDTQD